MSISKKRIVEILSFESAHGVDKAKIKFGIKENYINRLRREARLRGIEIPDSPEETREVSGTSTDIDAFIKEHNIDLEVWEVVSYDIVDGSWDVSAKDRDQDLSWEITRDEDGNPAGQYMEGHSKRGDWDTKKNKKYSIKVRLRKKKEVFDAEKFKRELVESVNLVSPYTPRREYVSSGNHCLEINIFDLHLSLLTWEGETGENYDNKIAQERFFSAIERFIAHAQTYGIDQILFPFGNDFFNSDSDYPYPTTTNGTPMDNDLRWQKSFKLGREMIINAVNRLSEIAPVALLGVPDNHAHQKTFYLGDVLDVRYENDENVTVDNLPKTRKYFKYGKNLIGFEHGKDVPESRLLMLMPQEEPLLWAETKYREWHRGHFHSTKKTFTMKEGDTQGISIHYMKSLKGKDAYEYSRGYESIGGAEAFIWHKTDGKIASFNYNL